MNKYNTSAPQNMFHQVLQNTGRVAEMAPEEGHNLSYGVITEVKDETCQVKVKLFLDSEKLSDTELSNGAFLPLLNPITQIHLLWGSLRPGLLVRVHWRGNQNPQRCIVEVVGDEDSPLLSKEPENNEIDLGIYRIMMGSLGA